MTQIKLRRDTSANFTSKNPILGVGEPAYETDTKKLKIGDGTTAYNSLAYFTITDEFAAYRSKYGAPSDSVPVVNAGNSITIKAGVSIETPNGTLNNTTDMTYTYDFVTDRVLFVTENDYYHAFAVYYGGKEPSPVGEQIFWFNNNVWTMIAGDGTKTVFNTQKITPIAKIYQNNSVVKNIDYSSYAKTSTGGGGSTNISATLPLKIVDGVISLEVDGQTIQIVDGKLHANLDDKQDKFETQIPLSISSNSITTSVPAGITETTESWSGGGPDNLITVDVSGLNVDANSDWKIHLSGYMGNYHTTMTNTNALIITTENETIFRVWFGSQDFRLGNGTSKFYKIPNTDREFYYEIVHQKDGTEFTFKGGNLVDTDPLPIQAMFEALGSGNYRTLAGKGRLKDFSFLINVDQFRRIDKDISKSYFEADGVRYPITSVEGINTLKLGVGDGLSVVDGKLTASSTAPANMVTTDTAQTITGLKTFGGTDLSKILLEGSESLISFRANADSLPTTLIGGSFDSNGKKSITIGSTDHETLSLNAKSVQDASGNKFLTSGNVTAYVTETYQNGTSWYRVWSDGWCEQGGYYANHSSGIKNFTFLKPFINNSYYLSCSATYTTNGNADHQEGMNEFVSRTVDGFSKYIWVNHNNFYWNACGYIK